ncbi:ABC transporter substrate-binding protein [Arthrobacter roseus]|uniref:ABC transporter substrate-binding protein n=1 Tax=Arthrobacter roseus TaxID=136274 RepID=UPI00196255EE|nr:ABC transporter substrate-binding protein [Arthrobacter roseus]MBM7846824.1 putative spermidine/putrescine transport system substrate-binding protein [Arthrobacter roseus]
MGTFAALLLAGCSGPTPAEPSETFASFEDVQTEADGQTVDLWMYGGDQQANSYADEVLIPAAAEQGVELRRVPVADTADAVNRVLTEIQAGRDDGTVDLVWVNGANFGTGQQADAWHCEWTDLLPNMKYTDPADPLITDDFGVPVNGCEAPWHKAQFTYAYNSDAIFDPPTSLDGIVEWAEAHPGRFTYPAPPDFTGSVFLREVMLSMADGAEQVPQTFSAEAFEQFAPAAIQRLEELERSLWREGSTYPRDEQALNQLFANGDVDMTMTYGPARLTDLVESGALPEATKVLTLDEGTVGNASFLAIPANAADTAGAMVVANLALSPEQQAAKADPKVWGQFTVLEMDKLSPQQRELFESLPSSDVVPPYEVMSRNAHAELSAEWVTALDDAWRERVAGTP